MLTCAMFSRTLPTSPGNTPASHVLDVVGLFRIQRQAKQNTESGRDEETEEMRKER